MTTKLLTQTLLGLAASAGSLMLATRVDSLRGPVQLNPALLEAIHQGNLASVNKLLLQGADANTKDAEGTPALMQCAVYSNVECMRLLLDRGADPNARNAAGATAIIWAAGDAAKVQLLLARNADVNARSGPGRTALLAAASQDGAHDTVASLLKAGADIQAKDNLTGPPPVFSGGGGALASIEAAKARNPRTLALLLAAGLPANAKDANGNMALSEAVLRGNRANVATLIAHGADVNAKIGLLQNTPLMLAAFRNDAAITRMLLRRGARVDDRNKNGDTALMWAAYTDTREPAVVQLLLEAGAEVNARNQSGQSAMTWAVQRGETGITRALHSAGADPAELPFIAAPVDSNKSLREAVESSIAAAQTSGPTFVKRSGCVSCHHQVLPAVATALAHKTGFHFDEALADRNLKSILSVVGPAREILLEGTDVVPDLPITGGNILLGLSAQGYAPDKLTDALVHNIASKQSGDGSWISWVNRPPLESGDIQATALGLRSLQLYGMPGRKKEFEAKIAKARAWLVQADPKTTEEQRMRLLGLAWSGAERETKAAARSLIMAQRPDGGWAQLPTLPSDAYATGSVLAALYETGRLTGSDAPSDRAVEYLLKTQQPDGTWLVKTRAYPFQPLVESGFVHGRDQWISISGTSWASIALMLSKDPLDARKWFVHGGSHVIPPVLASGKRHPALDSMQ